jgi:hypothetical protein
MNPRSRLFISVALTLVTVCCSAQTSTIQVRFVDGKTGKPIHLRNYFIRPGGNEYRGYTVNKVSNDAIDLKFETATTFTLQAEANNRCDTDTHTSTPVTYKVQEIVDTGVVSANFCGPLHMKPTKGEPVIYSRRPKWLESLKNFGNLFLCV